MKKKLMTAAAAVAAASLVLTACGSKPADETPVSESTASSAAESTEEAAPEATAEATEETDATLASIRAANQLDAVLADCGKIGIVSTYADENGTVGFTDTGAFMATDNGKEFRQDVEVDGNHTYITYKAVGDTPFAGYIENSGDHTLMLVDTDSVDELLNYYYVPTAYGTETVTEDAEQDGIRMVVVENTMDGQKVADTVYCVDPETLRLVTITQSLLLEDGTSAGTQTYLFSYGDDVDTEALGDVSDAMVNADDACTLTAVYHPGQSNEYTAAYTAAKGTYVSAYGNDGAAYLDAGLSDPAYGLTLDSDAMTVYVK